MFATHRTNCVFDTRVRWNLTISSRCEFYVTSDATRFIENTTTILQYPRYRPENRCIDNKRVLQAGIARL